MSDNKSSIVEGLEDAIAHVKGDKSRAKEYVAQTSAFLVEDIKAPHWANFAAMNKDGVWIWFDEKPRHTSKGWITGLIVRPNKWNVEYFKAKPHEGSWKSSLQVRPNLMNLKMKIELINDEIKVIEKNITELYSDIKRQHLSIHEKEDKILELKGYVYHE